MTVLDFQRELRATGRYTTPAEHRPRRPARPGWLAAWRFHSRTVEFVVRIGRRAYQRRFNCDAWGECCFKLWRQTENLGLSMTCEGFADRAAHTGPVVYVSNHMSMAETVLLPPLLLSFGPLTLVLKRSLLDYPFLGEACRVMRPIAVSRKNARDDLRVVLEQGKSCLADGISVLLFPQATRHPAFIPAQFNSLGEKLSREAGVPLMPLAVQTDFAGIGRWIKDFGPVDPRRPIRFRGGPLLAPNRPRAERHQATVAFISATLREWGLPVEGPA
jgi:1-acyl-sn-glycerol-3-phosphate acyltransferase